ncbi:MAG TPA: hypothetical protein VE076_02895, partial [Nitrososphaeraceae archaeon]|nr:hypothetical protein [Nitrososphaeraceae archaeon]
MTQYNEFMENVEYFQAKKREVTLRFRIEKDVVDQLCQNQKMKSLNVSVNRILIFMLNGIRVHA